MTRAEQSPAAAATSRGAPPAYAVVTDRWERAVLECDFNSPDQPGLVTELLRAFLVDRDNEPVEPIELWNLPLGSRLLALARIVAALDGVDALGIALRCPRPACREFMDVALSLADLAALQREPAGPATVALAHADGRALTVRRPTGADLRRWRAAAAPGTTAIDPESLRDLVLAGDLPADPSPVLDALAAADPLIAFTVVTACPACGGQAEHAVDLEAYALQRLRQRQAVLCAEIHDLARAYGWTEAEILAVPAARRARYRALIDARPAP